MLRRLYLENYRAFDRQDIQLSKVNLFFGPNNSGKSALLSAVNLLAQTLESTDPRTAILLQGKFEDLGSYRDIVYGNKPERDIKIGFDFDVKRVRAEEATLGSQSKSRRRRRLVEYYETGSLALTFHYRPRNRKIIISDTSIELPLGNSTLRTAIREKSKKHSVKYADSDLGPYKMKLLNRALEFYHFLPSLNLYSFVKFRMPDIRGIFNLHSELSDFTEAATQLFKGVEFIGPFRTQAERVYTFAGESPETVGVHGEKAVQTIVSDYFLKSKKRENITRSVSEWLQQTEMAKSIQPRILSPRHFEMLLTHFHSGETQNLADVGYGCSQILPILVAGFSRPAGSTFIVEQPELHLHPRAQAELGTFLYNLVKRNLQLLVETHSEHLLLRLLSHIASGELSPNDIAVYYVYADKEDRKKHVKRIPIGSDGMFKEEWPEGFFPERLREAKRLAGLSTR